MLDCHHGSSEYFENLPMTRQQTTHEPIQYSGASWVLDLAGCYRSAQRAQSTYMVQSMVSVVDISLMVWVSIFHMGT